MGNTLMTKFLQELVFCCFEQTNLSSFANIERFLVGFQVDYNFIRILDQKWSWLLQIHSIQIYFDSYRSSVSQNSFSKLLKTAWR